MVLSQSAIALLYLTAFILGAALGLFFDLLRFPRKLICLPYSPVKKATRSKRLLGVAVFFEDFLFCILSAVAMILIFYERNNGKIRPIAFLVTYAGFALYRITLGKAIERLTATVARLLRRAVRALLHAIEKPLKRMEKAALALWNRFWNAQREKVEKRKRKQTTEALHRAVAATACGLLPEDAVLKTDDGNKKRKKKRGNPHDGKEETAKDHRAKQKSMA